MTTTQTPEMHNVILNAWFKNTTEEQFTADAEFLLGEFKRVAGIVGPTEALRQCAEWSKDAAMLLGSLLAAIMDQMELEAA
jgi:hypothetical protein